MEDLHLVIGKNKLTILVGKHKVGPKDFLIIAGPCTVESQEQILASALAVKKAGAHALRGGAFKPRTSPYSFQGMGEAGLKLLDLARKKTGLPIVTEVMDTRDVALVVKYADCLQIGARNMQNFPLLKEVGKVNKPVLLKRGLSSTVSEFLYAAEYVMKEGNHQVILCERGIRTFETTTRNALDVGCIAYIKKVSRLPIIIDPSHASGRSDLVPPITLAGIAAGADGVIVEVHNDPKKALVDGSQTLDPPTFSRLVKDMKKLQKLRRH